jgi:peptidyl-prolyl cis-trans isomerase D
MSIRRKVTSGIVLLFLGLGVIALVVGDLGTGMGAFGGGGGAQAGEPLVRVEGRRVDETELSDLISRQYAQAYQQNPQLTMQEFIAGGAFDGLLNQLVIGRAIQAWGEAQGLRVSKRMVDREIVNIPAFRNFAGQFDENAFRQALQAQRVTEAQLRDDIASTLMQRQLLLPLTLGARVPEGVARQYAGLLLERRRGAIGVIPSELMEAGPPPSDQELAAFYRANEARFTIPERRVIRYAVFGREQVAGAARATEAEIQQVYRTDPQYQAREQRRLQQVVLPDQAAAQAFVQRVRGGTDFAAAAQAAGFSAADIALGEQTREGFATATNAEVANAAFGAAQGAVVGPVRSELGFHVIRVEAVSATGARPLETVRAEIARTIEERKTADALNAVITRIEERLEAGASFEEVVRTENLTVVETQPVTMAGAAPGTDYRLPPEAQPLLAPAFEMEPERDPVVETLVPNQSFALTMVARAIPAAAPPLAQVQNEVRAALMAQRALARARQIADQIVQRIAGGATTAQAFAQAGVRLPPPQPVDSLRLEIAQGGERVPPPLALLFSLPQGGARVLEAPNGAGWFVVHHVERTPGNPDERPELIQATRAQFQTGTGEEYAQQFARAIERASDIRRNDAAIQRARARLSGTGAQ